MKLQHVVFLTLAAAAVPSTHAERVLWTETATVRTKSVFGDDGGLLYQQNWDKATGEPVGKAVSNLGGGASPTPSYDRPGVTYQAAPPPAPPPAPMPPMYRAPGQGPTLAHGGHGFGAGSGSARPVAPPPSRGGQGWIQGPFPARPAQAPAASAAPLGRITAPEGFQNAHPEWSRLYRESQAPLPERNGYTLPPPPPQYPAAMAHAGGSQPPLVGRPGHPDTPGDGQVFNRVGGKVLMRPDNMVRVKVLDAMSSKRNKRGDTFRYVLLEPIMYGLRTLVPAGTKGVGRVGRAKSRGFFGRPGMLDLEFGSVDLPGATPARIYLAETIISPDPREPEAIGAGAVGLLAFGPLGVAGGALIRGHDVHVEAGSVFHVEVAVDVPYMHTASR